MYHCVLTTVLYTNKWNRMEYTNDLHDALLRKNGVEFWKCWRANFESVNNCVEVEGCVDSDIIVDKFASHFCHLHTHNNAAKAKELYDEYKCMRATYSSFPMKTFIRQ